MKDIGQNQGRAVESGEGGKCRQLYLNDNKIIIIIIIIIKEKP